MADIVLAQATTSDGQTVQVTDAATHGEAVELVDDHGGGSAGMPQLDVATFPNQIFWLVLALVAIYMILSRVALPRIGALLAERQGAISNDIAAAEDLRNKAAEAEAAYEKALADARTEAQRIAQAARDEMDADLKKAIAKADEEIASRTAESEKEIAAIRDQAAANVREVARDTAAEIVRALDIEADQTAVHAAVDGRLGA